MSLQDLSIRQRIWILTIGCLAGLVIIAGIAINKAQQQFIDLKREQYQSLTTVALKNIDYFYQAAQNGEMSELEARRHAREALVHLALDDRTYFYLVHTDEMLLAHPYVTSIYPADTAEQHRASLATNRSGKASAAQQLGLDAPLIDTMTIIKETHPNTYTGFVDYYMYLHPENGTAIVARMDEPNLPDIAELKTAYAAHFAPWDWVVVSGIYREDETATFLNWLISLAIITGIAILIMATLSWRITRSITRPLATTVNLMQDISHGTGDLSKRLQIEGKNELGAFAQGFNLFAEKIAEIVQRVLQTNKTVIARADELDTNMNRNVQRSEEQLAETEMLASATNELSYSLASVTEHAQTTAGSARAAEEASVHTREAMANNIRSIRKLASSLGKTQEEVQAMQGFSNQVSSVLEVIVSIAEQTNLLALNAAIEAARAGEQGRGFAVVADEVRTLAQRTQHSTKEINEIVENLQSGTRRVVKAMDQGLLESETCVSTADESSQELQRIVEYINEISQMNSEIASAVEQQSSTTQEIARSSQNIAESSRNNLSDSETNRKAIQAMNRQLRDMEELVRQFRA